MDAPRRGRVPFVGLTGGLGAGKSEALRALAALGAATLSTDAVVHDLLRDEEVRDAVVERLGAEVASDGELERSAIARRVFDDREARTWLEGFLWPRVGERMTRWRAGLERARTPPRAAVVEVPLLFESGMEDAFDYTVAVVAEERARAERAERRGHAAVESRAGRQLSQAEKAKRATFVIRNDGTLDELRDRMSELLDRIGR